MVKQSFKFWTALSLLVLMGVGVLLGFLFTIAHWIARMVGLL